MAKQSEEDSLVNKGSLAAFVSRSFSVQSSFPSKRKQAHQIGVDSLCLPEIKRGGELFEPAKVFSSLKFKHYPELFTSTFEARKLGKEYSRLEVADKSKLIGHLLDYLD